MAHFDLTKPGGFNDLDVPDGADWSDLDSKTERAINGDEGGTWAPSSTIYIGGEGAEGRFRRSIVNAVDSNHTYQPSGANQLIRIGSAVTGNRTYTLGTTGAHDGDSITFYAVASFGSTHHCFIHDQANITIYTVGFDASSDGSWVTCTYKGGAWEVSESAPSKRIQDRSYTWFSSGTIQFVPGTKNITWELCGGGGGGGGGTSPTIGTSATIAGSGAGGGGAEAVTKFVAINDGDVCTVTVGAGGTGALADADGGDGADSKVEIAGVVVARGAGAQGGGRGRRWNTSTPVYYVSYGGSTAKTALQSYQRSMSGASTDALFQFVHPGHGGVCGSGGGEVGGSPKHGMCGAGAAGTTGTDHGGVYKGGRGGGGGGASSGNYVTPALAAGAGGNGGDASAVNGNAGSNGANADAQSGCGGGGGGGAGNSPLGVAQSGGTGGNGGSGWVTVFYTGPAATVTGA